MNPRQAFATVVHEGDVEQLARVMKLTPGTLRNKANPNNQDHEPTLQQAVLATVHTGSPLIAEAFATLAGGVFVRTPSIDQSVPELYQGVHNLTRELGDVLREIDEGMKDGRLTPAERDKVQRNIFELIEKAAALGKRVEILAEPRTLSVAK